jgi:hypothetical protein
MANTSERLDAHLKTADGYIPKELPPGMISDMKIRLAFHMMLDENLRELSDQLMKIRHQMSIR